MEVDLRDIAYARSGDKGDTSNVHLAVYDERDYEWLIEHLTVDLVTRHFAAVVAGSITRYEMPGTRMLNFVMEKALQGGVARTLNLDMHGKSRASLMLSLQIPADPTNLPPSGRGLKKARADSSKVEVR